MPILTVGPTSTYPSIAAAMAAAGPGDTIQLETNYSNETATVTHNGMTVFGDAGSVGIVLQLATGIPTFTLTGTAPINVLDASDGNGIVGNSGDNLITVTGGVDAVDGGLGTDRLIVDYHLAMGAVSGDSTSNFTEAGAGGRMVTITAGTFENFTVLTGAGADTITTGGGDDIINTGQGAGTVSAGQGANVITGGADADTITALDGGNFIDGGDGTNILTSGAGSDTILSGTGADTIVSGAGTDLITVHGGADTVNAGADADRLIVDYSAMTTDVTGGVTSGDLATGYVGHIADLVVSTVDFQGTESFTITTGTGNDTLTTGGGSDVVDSGAGNDSISTGDGNDTIFGRGGDDFLRGGAGNDDVRGGVGNDLVVGGLGDDSLSGGANDDILNGGLGNDLLDGTSGFDTAGYLNSTVGVSVSLAIVGQQQDTVGAGLDTLSNIDNLIGSNFADRLVGDVNNNTLVGKIGDDVLQGAAGDDRIFGDEGNDDIRGGQGSDLIVGGAGNDTMTGGTVAANDPADTFVFAPNFGNDTILDFHATGPNHDFLQFDDTIGTIQLVQNGADTLVFDNGGNSVLVKGVLVADLTPDIATIPHASLPTHPDYMLG